MGLNQTKLKTKLLSRIDIQDDGCWIWLGSKGRNGYGTMTFECQTLHTHRASWLAHKGDIPCDLCVLHACDNRGCINPEHLFLGTYQDNHNDMAQKGRDAYGHNAKLTKEQAEEIRYLLAEGSFSQYKIGQIYGVSRSTVLQIHRGKTYI